MMCCACSWIYEDEAIEPVSITVGRNHTVPARHLHFGLCDDCQDDLIQRLTEFGLETADDLRKVAA